MVGGPVIIPENEEITQTAPVGKIGGMGGGEWEGRGGREEGRGREVMERVRSRSRRGSMVGRAVIILENEEITQTAPGDGMVVVTDIGEEKRKKKKDLIFYALLMIILHSEHPVPYSGTRW